jgi:hypothetical protein
MTGAKLAAWRCPLCHQPTHLWMDNSGWGWMHDRAADEWACWREHRAELEQATRVSSTHGSQR